MCRFPIHYFNDPLVFRSLTFKFGNEITTEQKFVNENIEKLKIPTLVLHGDQDKVVPIKASEGISKLENVKFITVENSKHEILNQDTRTFVLSEIYQWFKKKNIICTFRKNICYETLEKGLFVNFCRIMRS